MKFRYNGERLIEAIRTKRLIKLNIGVRMAAKKIGTSPATLSRVENGSMPDLITLVHLCNWSGLSMYDCIEPVKPKKTKRSLT